MKGARFKIQDSRLKLWARLAEAPRSFGEQPPRRQERQAEPKRQGAKSAKRLKTQ